MNRREELAGALDGIIRNGSDADLQGILTSASASEGYKTLARNELRLRGVAIPPPAPWTRHDLDPNAFTTDASDLRGHKGIACPKCSNALPLLGTAIKDAEGETLYWLINHPCGASFRIFND